MIRCITLPSIEYYNLTSTRPIGFRFIRLRDMSKKVLFLDCDHTCFFFNKHWTQAVVFRMLLGPYWRETVEEV